MPKKDDVVKAVLEGDDACALAVMRVVEHLFGDKYIEWEPETFRMEFDERGIDVLDENFDALMAGITLIKEPSFFYDANVFENVCVALNSESPQFDTVHELCPAQIAWGVFQAQAIVDALAEYDLPDDLPPNERFDYEPIGYTSAACIHAGFVTVPAELEFARERLEEHNNAHDAFISKVKKAWSELDHSRLLDHPLGEDAVGVQLALMATIKIHHQERMDALQFQCALLD